MKSDEVTDGNDLRRRAEERLKSQSADETTSLSADETHRLLHELQVHQVELEMQNEELLQARDNLETLLDKYTGLYDFAPVGYFTLTRAGNIHSVNLAGAALLSVERSRLIDRRFGDFVATTDRIAFADFLNNVFTNEGNQTCELALRKEENPARFVQIEAVPTGSE